MKAINPVTNVRAKSIINGVAPAIPIIGRNTNKLNPKWANIFAIFDFEYKANPAKINPAMKAVINDPDAPA